MRSESDVLFRDWRFVGSGMVRSVCYLIWGCVGLGGLRIGMGDGGVSSWDGNGGWEGWCDRSF